MKGFALCFVLFLATATATTFFQEEFNQGMDGWVASSDSGKGVFDISAGEFFGDAEADKGLHTTQDAKFYDIAAAFDTPFSNKGKDLVIQFSVKHQQGIDCGGGYLKVLKSADNLDEFNGETDYAIMFGPDICGNTKKVHVIFNYKGENHLISKNIPVTVDIYTHLYTLIVKPDQTYIVKIDGEEVEAGSMTEDWDFLLPKTIKDPTLSKPADWVDEAMIVDVNDVKPAGYDDIPAMIVDPEAEEPEDWDEESDGEYEAPTIPNPDYQGPFQPKMIANPAYEGEWQHPMVPNPDYEEDSDIYAYDSLAAVGFDLWQVKSGTIFDNIYIGDSVAEAEALMASTFSANIDAEKQAKADFDAANVKANLANAAAQAEEDDDEEELHDEL